MSGISHLYRHRRHGLTRELYEAEVTIFPIAQYQEARMSIHCFFKKRFPLRNRAGRIVFLFSVLLISGCGGEESADKPIVESVGDEKPINEVPISTIYYPMTVGSRWVYRNTDGSEWTWEITETENYGDNFYHYFNSDPPIQDTQIESLKSPVYVAFLDRLDRRIVHNDINAAISEIIVDSGGETPSWSLGMRCSKRGRQKAVCESKKDRSTPGILTYLYRYNASVASHSNLTLFPFPLVPGETFNALNLRLRGRDEGSFYVHDFEAEVVILGKTGEDRELVGVSAGKFEDCLKIQYEAELASYRTIEFRDLHRMISPKVYLETIESEIRKELTDLSMHLTTKLELQTVWLAPGVGPVKIETPNGIAELIDYEVKAVASGQ